MTCVHDGFVQVVVADASVSDVVVTHRIGSQFFSGYHLVDQVIVTHRVFFQVESLDRLIVFFPK